MITNIHEILQTILERLDTQPVESVSVVDSLHRVIADDIHASFSLPPYDAALIDGYAVRVDDVTQLPISLTLRDYEAFGELVHGEAMRVCRWMPLPRGANAVVSYEECHKLPDTITITHPMTEEQNVLLDGIDVEKDQVLIKAGTIINTRHMALLGAMQIPWVPVRRKPRVAIIAGEESPCGKIPGMMDMSASYALVLRSLIASYGGEPIVCSDIDTLDMRDAGFARIDNLNKHLKEADLWIATGSFFCCDDAEETSIWRELIEQGAEVSCVSTMIEERETLVLGRYKEVPLLAIPGGMTDILISAAVLLRPMIFHMLNTHPSQHKTYKALLGRNLDMHDRKRTYLHGTIETNDHGQLVVYPVTAQDSLTLSSFAQADCLIVMNKQPIGAENVVEIILLRM